MTARKPKPYLTFFQVLKRYRFARFDRKLAECKYRVSAQTYGDNSDATRTLWEDLWRAYGAESELAIILGQMTYGCEVVLLCSDKGRWVWEDPS